jgi:hypothetical protein
VLCQVIGSAHPSYATANNGHATRFAHLLSNTRGPRQAREKRGRERAKWAVISGFHQKVTRERKRERGKPIQIRKSTLQ